MTIVERVGDIKDISDIPWDETDPSEAEGSYYVVRRPPPGERRQGEAIIMAAKQVLAQVEKGPTVSQWLPSHLQRLDAITRTYELVRGPDSLSDIVFDELPPEVFEELPPDYFGTDVMFQLIILFRSAWQGALRDPLLVLSDIPGTSGDQTFHRARVVLVWALEQDALDIAPGAASALGIEDLSHQLFRQIASKGLDRTVVLARRRVDRVDEQQVR